MRRRTRALVGGTTEPFRDDLAPISFVRNVRSVAQIVGIRVTDSDAWWIVDELRTIGRADDATAAFVIERGLARNEPIDCLTADQEQAVMLALTYAPVSLEPLRRKLARNHYDRT